VPEGDTILRAAQTLHRALAGHTITRFESVLPALTRVDDDTPIVGRTLEAVSAAGKNLLMRLSAPPVAAGEPLVLRTHMRMNGSWHIYRPGERWQKRVGDMRIVVGTTDFVAVGFNVPVAELHTERSLARARGLRDLGPDLLADRFDEADALRRLRERGAATIAEALLDQRAMAGAGNVFKSEILFACRVSPFTAIRALTDEALLEVVRAARRMLTSSVHAAPVVGGIRRTTRRLDPDARLWVYGRGGDPCRVCGTSIERATQGEDARSTYWCPRCQA
jgi:endonuclease VIII